MDFADKLNGLLEDSDISQKDFAAILNIAPSTLNGYVRNRRQPDFETLKKMAAALNVSIDFLLDYNNSDADLSVQELSLILEMRKMKKAQREIIYDLVKIILEKHNN